MRCKWQRGDVRGAPSHRGWLGFGASRLRDQVLKCGSGCRASSVLCPCVATRPISVVLHEATDRPRTYPYGSTSESARIPRKLVSSTLLRAFLANRIEETISAETLSNSYQHSAVARLVFPALWTRSDVLVDDLVRIPMRYSGKNRDATQQTDGEVVTLGGVPVSRASHVDPAPISGMVCGFAYSSLSVR